MKELKFNLRYVLNKKELYFSFILVLMLGLIQVLMIIQRTEYYEFNQTSENLILAANVVENLAPVVVLVLPVVSALILSDSTWLDENRKTHVLLYPRLNYKRNIIIRWVLSIVVVFIVVYIGLMINYLVLNLIFGSGNMIAINQSFPYNISADMELFLAELHLDNPMMYVLVANGHVSLILALLASLSYSLSFFIRQRLVIYFQVLLIMFVYEVANSILNLEAFSIIYQLQVVSHFTVSNALGLYAILFIASLSLLTVAMRREVVL